VKDSAIAIVGMAGRFPGARNIGEFWRNLRDGRESIRQLSDAELTAAGVSAEELANPDYVKAAAVLDDVEMFDASFFGFSPKDAAIMDPQHRHFLECAWEALEHSGHTADGFPGSIGVYAGSGMNSYLIHNLLTNRKLVESAGLFLLKQTGNDKDVLATRVSYQLNLRGPSISVQTACSTSLVAVHLACQSLLNQECDMVLAGGVTIEIPHARGYVYREGEILSRDGHCRSFDASSSGTVFSSGAGVVVLRRLQDALDDGDTIHAVILGSAVNNDGSRKIGYLAPSVEGQAEVVAEALAVAGVNADDISYVETHGTGTTVGDPIEIKGLTQAFRETTAATGYCAIGSLKSSVGHLDAAAGVAGLIKTVLALGNREIPPSLHFQKPNPLIDFANTPFCVNTKLAAWKSNGTPRRAGVTSLGIGGTNAHVVLEEGSIEEHAGRRKSYQLVVLSAKTEAALDRAGTNLARHLEAHPDLPLADVAFTCQAGRKAFPHRRAVVARDAVDAGRALATRDSSRVTSGLVPDAAPKTVFLFSGQGSQYAGMGRELYDTEAVFQDSFDACAKLLLPVLGIDLRPIVFSMERDLGSAGEKLSQTWITQPALFAFEYSLARWWIEHGVRPQAMLGHSIGEYVAACLAGVMSLEDALGLSAARGQLMYTMPPGAMLAVPLSAEGLSLDGRLSVAAVNGPEQCVVSGPPEAVDELEKRLTARNLVCRRLHISHAFHSSMMDPVLESFTERVGRVTLRAPEIPYLSNVTGKWITAAEATSPEYWAKHLRGTVRFSDSLAELYREPGRILLEVGPGQALTSLARQHPARNAKVFASLRHTQEKVSDAAFLLNAAGQLWTCGQSIDWSAFHFGGAVKRVPLPTYPFEKQRHWIEPGGNSLAGSLVPLSAPPAREITDRLFQRRTWRQTALPAVAKPESAAWMVFLDTAGLGKQIVAQLTRAGQDVIRVSPGRMFQRLNSDEYTIRAGVRGDFDVLLADLGKRKNSPTKIVHLWSVRDDYSQPPLDEALDLSFYSLLFLAQALGDKDLSGLDIAIVSNQLQSVSGEAITDPARAALFGPAKVIPKEFAGISCRVIDVNLEADGARQSAAQVIAEISARPAEALVAYRGSDRWVETFDWTELHAASTGGRLKQKGVYLITGGLGGLGLVIARHLAHDFRARLVLLGRTALPPRNEWPRLLDEIGTADRVKQEIRKLRELESLGAEILTVRADVARRDEMKQAVRLAHQRFGAINGVIHAAGVIEDSPLMIKTRESAARVLEPKIKGTLVLNEVLRDQPLDFFVLFSSVSALIPPAGQVDYAAANAFLDAFATSRRDPRVISINWGLWRDVGMGARTIPPHPLLQRRVVETVDEIVFSSRLSGESHWVLNEHRFKSGSALVPGTGYLEMAAAALTRGAWGSGVTFQDVFFLSPLHCEAGQAKEVRVRLRGGRSGFRFSVLSREAEWTENATGQIAVCMKQPPPNRNLAEIAARCHCRDIQFDDAHRTQQERYFNFGPRWRNLTALHLGEQEAFSDLELHEEFCRDTDEYWMHPALLDLAAGSALYLISGYEEADTLYLPLSYKKATFYRRLPLKFHSHIRSSRENTARREVASFDITLLDEDGRVLAEIEEFSMRRITDSAAEAALLAPLLAPAFVAEQNPRDTDTPKGISSFDGANAFNRILSAEVAPSIAVLADSLIATAFTPIVPAVHTAEKATDKDDVEAVLASWWQELLGAENVGLDNDFFDLGGHSLIAVRLFSKIKKTYRLDLGLSTLFEARTIRDLAQLIRKVGTPSRSEPEKWSSLVPIQPQGSRPPLFVISGLGGNVLNFEKLAAHLGEDQPLYALQPQGLDGRKPFLTRVEDMAAYYIEEMCGVQDSGPYWLAGYSFGGFVAFEMAQQLLARGGQVGLLGLLDTIEWDYLERIKGSLRPRERFALYRSRLDNIFFGEDRWGYLKRRLTAKCSNLVYRIFKTLGRPLPQSVGTVEDINSFAAAMYKPEIYPGILTIFRSTVREPLDGGDELLGWGGFAAGGIEVRDVPGTHHNITREPNVRLLAQILRQSLDAHHARLQEIQHSPARETISVG
jgi:acyl transferase domain-containing protein/thioesterase domain-containing protein/acyl carrier protein